jgi:hypothetical protein
MSLTDINRIIGLAVGAMAACSCAPVTLVTPPSPAGPPSPHAPVNEIPRRGVVKYYNEGEAEAVQQRRELAYQQMHEACGGPYRIHAEGPNAEGESGASYWYVQFHCVAADGPVAAAPR